MQHLIFSLTSYGNIGSGVITDTSYQDINPIVATANSMTLNTSFGSTNAIQSYDLSFSLDVTPVYKMGDMFVPSKYEVASPITVSTNFEIFANEYEIKNLIDSVCSSEFVENISFSLNEKCNSNPIRSFTLNNAKLTSSNITAGIGNNLGISLGFENQFTDTSDLVSQVFHDMNASFKNMIASINGQNYYAESVGVSESINIEYFAPMGTKNYSAFPTNKPEGSIDLNFYLTTGDEVSVIESGFATTGFSSIQVGPFRQVKLCFRLFQLIPMRLV